MTRQETHDDGRIHDVQVGKSTLKNRQGFFEVLGPEDDIRVFGRACLLHPARQSVGANQHEVDFGRVEDGNDADGVDCTHLGIGENEMAKLADRLRQAAFSKPEPQVDSTNARSIALARSLRILFRLAPLPE